VFLTYLYTNVIEFTPFGPIVNRRSRSAKIVIRSTGRSQSPPRPLLLLSLHRRDLVHSPSNRMVLTPTRAICQKSIVEAPPSCSPKGIHLLVGLVRNPATEGPRHGADVPSQVRNSVPLWQRPRSDVFVPLDEGSRRCSATPPYLNFKNPKTVALAKGNARHISVCLQ